MTRRAMIMMMTSVLNWTFTTRSQEPLDRNNKQHPLNVSLIQVIANPDNYDGQRLTIIGYLDRNGIDLAVGIYLSAPDGEHFVISNSIDLEIAETVLRGLLGKYVIFSGTYHKPSPRSGHNGHFGQIVDLKLWNAGDTPQ